MQADRLVVVGASAGGIDALGELLAALPTDFEAAIVVAQHLDPKRRSHLAEILQGRTSLPVRLVEQRETLRSGNVYIVPADHDVVIEDGALRLDDHEPGTHPKPSIDRLFRSAADAFGERLLAVVLTGAGSDGSEGARRVKLAGGTVIIQDPATAKFPSMPQSLAPSTVDVVARLEAIPQVLSDLLRSEADPETLEDEVLGRFLEELRDRSGIDFSAYKRPTILRRLHRRMAALRIADLKDYVRFASRDPHEYEQLVGTFLIKVTEFFRDPELYEILRTSVLPSLLEEATASGRELRIWSAGCATGEEAYSLGILVAEILGDGPAHDVRIFATDLDEGAIEFARRGIYSRSALGNVSDELITRYFSRVGDDYEVAKRIRAMIVFGHHDLAQRAPFPRIDLAVSRNVLIYFTPELQRRALQLFAFSLRIGGYLVLGKAETVTPFPEQFVLDNARLKVYRRHGKPVLIPPAKGLIMTPATSLVQATRQQSRTRTGSAAAIEGRPGRVTSAGRADHMLMRLPVGFLALGRDYEVLMINDAARRILGIHVEAIGQDFVHLAHVIPSQLLRDAIDAARAAGGDPVTQSVEVETTTGEHRTLSLVLVQRPIGIDGDVPESVLILVEDVTSRSQETGKLQVSVREAEAELDAMRRRLTAVEQARQQLLEANSALTLSNAELRSANEELLVGTEEIQAATEEVETLNEELQATNEELETLNEELQATVEELNTTNDDLEARSAELEEAIGTLAEQRAASERERDRMAHLFVDRNEGLVVIDPQGKAVLRSDTWVEFARADDLSPADDPGARIGLEELLEQVRSQAARSESFVLPFLRHPEGAGITHYELRGEGLPDDGGRNRGSVISIVRRQRRPSRSD